MTQLARSTSKLVALTVLVAGAAYLTGCCCCGPSIPGPEYYAGTDGRSTLPDLKELRGEQQVVATSDAANVVDVETAAMSY